MKNLTRTICRNLAVLFGTAGRSWGADYEKGIAAYESGDYATALRQLRPLAEQGDARAQNTLGHMYYNGQGGPENYKTAMKWYTLAAEQGDTYAQYAVGVMYEKGVGVPQDNKTAMKWYTLAAEQGNADAQHALGVMHEEGRDVE